MASTPKIHRLNFGVEKISRWRVEDEIHLPAEAERVPAFLPQSRPLDEILKRPSLDERVRGLLEPLALDPELLKPSVMSNVRAEIQAHLSSLAKSARGNDSAVYGQAVKILAEDDRLDREVRAALAALLKG